MTNTSNDLAAWVDHEMTVSGLDDEVGLVVLAALEGDVQLDEYLEHGTSPALPAPPEAGTDEAAGGTFLRSITAEGFRGIGESVTLELQPRPGLTIVAGRNGSGKSSLSEALEFVLTGDTYRWNKSSVAWRQSWRNLHHGHSAITVEVIEESAGPLSIKASWVDTETDVRQATIKTQRPGGKQQTGLDGLGWSRALEQYRPILSYDELGGLLEGKPTELYDSLAAILGVEQLTDALKRIQTRHKEAKAPTAGAIALRKQLAQQASGIADERAASAATMLKKTSPDTAALRALATGTAPVEQGPVQSLRGMIAVTVPYSDAEAVDAAERLRRAVAGYAEKNAEVSARSLARLDLLERALRVHEEHGDMTCPVCRTGQLDVSWHETSAEMAAGQRRDYEDVRLARQDLDVALAQARRLVSPRPAALTSGPLPELEEAVATARTAWDEWSSAPEGDTPESALALASHLERHSGQLVTAVDSLKSAATYALTSLDDVWQPFATQVGAWCDDWDRCLLAKPAVDRLAQAEQWLKANDLRLKNERLAPIAEGAKAAWAKLRQESNIEIGELTLTGSGPQRKLRIDASVDDAPGQGFTVLSQGELHALALSLFLPRAAMPNSPFRFVVLDDPVQAMDPAKVDGLVDLLGELAQSRQVVVLSHDDRLPAAVRRSQVDATVLEVTRGTGSRVSIAVATDPAQRYLQDAFGLVLECENGNVNDTAMRRTVPGLLRFAAEAAAKDRYFTERLSAGVPLDELEKSWDNASTTRQKVILAVFSEPRENHELDNWASAPHRKFGLRNIGSAMHNGLKPDLNAREAVRDVGRLVDDIRSMK